MNRLEWDGIIHNEKTKRGYEIMRLSKNGNIRIVYNKDAIQGKYSIERKRAIDGCWDRFTTAIYSSDVLSEVINACKYMADEPLDI